jgi:hypothetical protein
VKFKEDDIITPRLALVAITPESLQSERSADGLLGAITNTHVPRQWPPEHWEPHVFELLLKRIADEATEVGWHRYIALRHADKSRTLIGTLGGFRKAGRVRGRVLSARELSGQGVRYRRDEGAYRLGAGAFEPEDDFCSDAPFAVKVHTGDGEVRNEICRCRRRRGDGAVSMAAARLMPLTGAREPP